MDLSENTSFEDFLHTLIPHDFIQQRARDRGFIQRKRKLDLIAFISVVLFTLPVQGTLSRAAMWRAYIRRTGNHLSRTAFFDRFSPKLRRLLRDILDENINAANQQQPKFSGILHGFRDVIVADATIINVHPSLARRWPGTHPGTAAIKLHTWIRATTGQLLKHRLTQGTASEARTFGVTWNASKKLFLLDRGYAGANLWWRIHRVRGFFLTRLPASYKPQILKTHQKRDGHLLGRSLRGVLLRRRRPILDVSCGFRVRVNGYRQSRGRYKEVEFRVVGLRHPRSGEHHLYVTNLPTSRLAASAIGELYRLRWEVEVNYKAGKSFNGLNAVMSRKGDVVKSLVYASLLRLTVSMQARQQAEKHLPSNRFINPLMWARVWNEELGMVVEFLTQHFPITTTFKRLAQLACCPERRRIPVRVRIQQPHPQIPYF